MIIRPPAKINLGLNIVQRREDGYHDIETLFYAIPFYDKIEITPQKSGSTQLVEGTIRETGNPSDNLVMKAYHLLSQHVGGLPPVTIHLYKYIPSGGGLGGGSSDASATLLALRELFHLDLSKDQLRELAVQLGADCPFFITPTPHYAHGIGEKLEPYPLDLSGTHLYLILPNIHVSTAEAYAGVTPHQPTHSLKEVLQSPITEWRGRLTNDFETSVFTKHPKLSEIKDRLYSLNADYAAMSGSGSTMYALSQSPIDEKVLHKTLPYRIEHFIL